MYSQCNLKPYDMLTAKILVTIAVMVVLFIAAFLIDGITLMAGVAICLLTGAGLNEMWKLKG